MALNKAQAYNSVMIFFLNQDHELLNRLAYDDHNNYAKSSLCATTGFLQTYHSRIHRL